MRLKLLQYILFPSLFFYLLIILLPSNVVQVEHKIIRSFTAVVTAYSRADSCHFPNCLNASGKPPKVGTIACSRSIPLGTKIRVLGSIYECQDRYALYLDKERKMPTIDIFMDKGADKFGKVTAKAEVLAKI